MANSNSNSNSNSDSLPPILFFSPVSWHGLRQRHQALASGLAERGFLINFVEPLQSGGFGLTVGRHVDENISILQLRLPFRASGWPGLQAIAVRLAVYLMRRSGFLTTHHLLWIAEPAMASLIRYIPSERQPIVYDRCDLHGAFPGQRLQPWRTYERLLFERADLILASSPALLPSVTGIKARMLLLSNAASVPKNIEKGKISKDKEFICRPQPPPWHILSAGAHYEWVDSSWLARIADLSDVVLHLAGPLRGSSYTSLLKHPSVMWHGTLSHDALSKLMTVCHIGLIPFCDSELTRRVDPIKAYEYKMHSMFVWATGPSQLQKHQCVDIYSPAWADPASVWPIVCNKAVNYRSKSPTHIPTWDDRIQCLLKELDLILNHYRMIKDI